MQSNFKNSNSGLFLGMIALILSVLAGFSVIISCVTFYISLIIAIPFGLVAIILGFLAIILGKIGLNQARNDNGFILIPKTGFVLGSIVISIIFIGGLLFLYLMASALMH
ncbi:hypothetical protein L1276_001264 [Flavobacterium sp. HSC-32F16]|uniref:hypothetical protein n=1 Tax=Flavobacterium sp. HSC-32F16 TaxID=2910964 RepID=UPI0020A36DE3|nr:hypothetical protein [Flavobacterium sp. HSC-32F16]MCP2026124.1 hypothetical protein [Flavobacterium sp. HSC-32F16]